MEMIQILRKKKLTIREHQIVWFLIGELQGNLLEQKLIKTIEFEDGTGIPTRHIIYAIKSLIAKGIIERQTTSLQGCYWYNFNKKTFGRVYAVETVKKDVKGLKLIQGGKSKKLSTNDENPDSDVTQDRYSKEPDVTQDRYPRLPTIGRLARTKSTQSFYRDKNFPEVKELNAPSKKPGDNSHFENQMTEHERRKKEEAPRGSNIFAEICERARKASSQ